MPCATESKCWLIGSFNCFYHQELAAQVPMTVSVYSRYQCVHVCIFSQLCLTLCDPMDFSLPCSPVRGIFQARVLEWGAIAFSKVSTKYLKITTKPHLIILHRQLHPTSIDTYFLYVGPYNKIRCLNYQHIYV